MSRSPSSRRAWIEITSRIPPALWQAVALLAEGVDRNAVGVVLKSDSTLSPSSRRAWIEIRFGSPLTHSGKSPSSRRAWIEIYSWRWNFWILRVALLAEGVDRNLLGFYLCLHRIGVALLAEGVDRNRKRGCCGA